LLAPVSVIVDESAKYVTSQDCISTCSMLTVRLIATITDEHPHRWQCCLTTAEAKKVLAIHRQGQRGAD